MKTYCDFENARKISKEYRTGVYLRSLVQRFSVPDSKVSWNTEYEEYDPPSYTDPKLNGKPYADPEIGMSNFTPKWNNIDGYINRISYTSQYEIVNNFPRNPIGRTGLQGRGVLGRWGPNHAADCIVTRWKKIDNSSYSNEKSLLQFVAIKRSDTGEWALPGGMVDPGETFSAAAFREFVEESLNYFKISKNERENWLSKLKDFFSAGIQIYSGYIDSPRNTDNAWIESTAFNFHDETGFTTEALQLQAGDDAAGAKWMDVTPELNLYPAHKDFVNAVLSLRLQ
ncbi:ADP-ribose pyrophosphatase, mitochondrial-like [Aricia agestis]|uniref:ADP-ribose pyrophosphatase, mitochondrial-like n=1 Tax=Aricia agestis TaxID=91739 RepID=UPI001C20B61E|nr:ADP-ribose pyrophosphatase, mitochondrial-like [Aricia agestis]